jgi:methionyl-tRNA formyltransferase
MARIVYFSRGGFCGVEILKWLRAMNDDIVAIVIDARGREKYEREEIIRSSGMAQVSGLDLKDFFLIFHASDLRQPDFLEKLRRLKPDYIISLGFSYIFNKELLDIPTHCVINRHMSLLPLNQGTGCASWAIMNGTPHGVTFHYVDESIDTGDIIAQKEVKVDFTDTAASLGPKIDTASVELFKEIWESIKKGTNKRIKQTGATFHKREDFRRIQEIDLNRQYKAEYLINLLRASTGAHGFGPAYVRLGDGRKINITISLEEASNKT